MCEDKTDDMEIGLILHVLLRLFTEDYGSESFYTLQDTHCKEKFITHYYELYERHEETEFFLYTRLQEFVQLHGSIHTLPPEFVFYVFVEEFVDTLSFDSDAFMQKLDLYTNNKAVVKDIMATFAVSKTIVKSTLKECEKLEGFHPLIWSRYYEELEHIVRNLLIEDI